jgi:hypothetical protein
MRQALFYSLKVWLTTVSTAPILYSLVLFVVDKDMIDNAFRYAGSWPLAYIMYTLLFTGISFIPWITYWLIVWILRNYCSFTNPTSWLPTIVAEAVLVISFAGLYIINHGDVDFLFFIMLTCFALVLLVTTRFFKLAGTINILSRQS